LLKRCGKKIEHIVSFRLIMPVIQRTGLTECKMKQGLSLVLVMIVAGCGPGVTPEGYFVRPISSLTAERCMLLGPASEQQHTRSSAVRDLAISTANARNRVAAMGGNAFTFSIASSTPRGSIHQKNAYRCPLAPGD
jgi:hypothetical protein